MEELTNHFKTFSSELEKLKEEKSVIRERVSVQDTQIVNISKAFDKLSASFEDFKSKAFWLVLGIVASFIGQLIQIMLQIKKP